MSSLPSYQTPEKFTQTNLSRSVFSWSPYVLFSDTPTGRRSSKEVPGLWCKPEEICLSLTVPPPSPSSSPSHRSNFGGHTKTNLVDLIIKSVRPELIFVYSNARLVDDLL